MCCCLVLWMFVVVQDTWKGEARLHINVPAKGEHDAPPLPYFLKGKAEYNQHHGYGADAGVAKHYAHGEGLTTAVTGQDAKFTIVLGNDHGTEPPIPGPWNLEAGRFVYVWIANKDQMLAAEVENNRDGTLTATYASDFPGTYNMYIEDVRFVKGGSQFSKVQPIRGSPFTLTISGNRTIDINALPICDSEQDAPPSSFSSFWRTGTWISSTLAKHGVGRTGWVFQPKHCSYNTFSFEDLMMLAALEEPTWLLFVGTSVQRGVFLAIVDMLLSKGQKDNFPSSALQKCWGWSDFRIGSLRVSYQDMRIWSVDTEDLDSVVCHNKKLVSGSSAGYLRDTRDMFQKHIFAKGRSWPTVMMAPAYLEEDEESRNLSIEVAMEELPPEWDGQLMFIEHMHALNYVWDLTNPTRKQLSDIDPVCQRTATSGRKHSMDAYKIRLKEYQDKEPHRITFLSILPMQQAIFFENETQTKSAKLCYGCSTHFHYVSTRDDPKSYGGAKMVHSLMTEMIANIMIAKAVGSPASIHWKAAKTPHIMTRSDDVRKHFQICTDCPRGLFPFHVKAVPQAPCVDHRSLPADKVKHAAWNTQMCPEWCSATTPVGQTPTESGLVDVRECNIDDESTP